MFKKFREMKILAKVRANAKRDDLLKGLALNEIRSEAANLLLQNKISENFYFAIFTNEKINMYHPYWEVNYETIMNYKF